MSSLAPFLPVGIVQTTLDADVAWTVSGPPSMSAVEDRRAWHEIRRAMRAFRDEKAKPKIILFPELSIPRSRLNDFERLVGALNAIVIAGVDYRLDRPALEARNEAIVFVPNGFWRTYPSKHCTRIQLGKTHPAPREKDKLGQLSPPWKFVGDDNIYLIDAAEYGRIGVSICYDFMDIERALMYRGQIHHLFVVSYNKDLSIFRAIAESLSRTVFCNVVVCNTGRWGGSIAVSPYYQAAERTLYAHGGQQLFTTQVVNLPVRELDDACQVNAGPSAHPPRFKQPPPGLRRDGLPSGLSNVEREI